MPNLSQTRSTLQNHEPDADASVAAHETLAGDGELGARMRAIDWAQTPLGPVHSWPQSLKTAVRIILTSRQPMFVWWGDALINLYNDASKAIVGGKHPHALGQPASIVWREIWDQVGPRVAAAMQQNIGTHDETLLLIMERNGYPEETYYSFSYSPVPNDQGGTGGVFCANSDDTQRVIGDRQLALLRELAAHTADARTLEDACTLSVAGLATNPYDLPFALIYLVDNDGQQATLCSTCGITNHAAAPATVLLNEASVWPFVAAHATHQLQLVSDLATLFGPLPTGAWDRAPQQAVVLPIVPTSHMGSVGMLVVALNPYRLFDEQYRGFIQLVASQVTASFANAQAFEDERRRAELLVELDQANLHLALAQMRREVVQREQVLRAEAEAVRSQLATVLDGISDAFVSIDRDWRYTYINDQAQQMLGPQIDFIGQHVWAMFPDAVNSTAFFALHQAMDEQIPVRFEDSNAALKRWYENRAYATASGIAVFFTDITARKLTEDRLRRLQIVTARFTEAQTLAEVRRVVLNEVLEAISADAGALRQVTEAGLVLDEQDRGPHISPENAHRFDYIPMQAQHPAITAAVSGKPVFLSDIQEMQEQYPAVVQAAIIDKRQANAHLPLKRGGQVFAVLTMSFVDPHLWDDAERSFALALAGRVAVSYERARLFEELRASEEQLRILYAQELAARQQAEEASRLKDEFLATVSHELRTPLTAILGYSHLLQSRPRDAAYIQRTLAKILSSAKVQAQITEDLLDVARIVTGKLRLETQPLDMGAVVHAAADAVRPALDAKDITLEIKIDPTANDIVGDPNRLQQVVWNLLSNATKFTPEGGTVRVHGQAQGSLVQLVVSDTGAGIEASFLPYVFDRFRQGGSGSTRIYGGLGLGLSIVRHLVEMHGGTVEAHSAGLDQGATFIVSLPRRVSSTVHSNGSSTQEVNEDVNEDYPPELAGLRVLVVDDQHTITELLDEVLSASGAVVRTTTTAPEALVLLKTWRPDVLVSDIAMPDEDGYWLIRAVRALPAEAGGTTPALALTAYVRVEDRVRVLEAGFQQYVSKPVEPTDLRAAIARLSAFSQPSKLADSG